MIYNLKRLSDTFLMCLVELVHDCQINGPVHVDVLISGCVCILSSIPKANFVSIRGLPVSSPVWT